MKTSVRYALAAIPLVALLAAGSAMFVHTTPVSAQGEPGSISEANAAPRSAQAEKPLPSPAAQAEVTLDGKAISIHYNSPRMRGRKIMGELVPYGKVWRTGANPATSFVTDGDIKIGDLNVPAGKYTLYTLPAESGWHLIINKQTGQWGTEYHEDQDLGRVPMHSSKLPSPQEDMSISFEHTTHNSTELHVRWETTDEWVKIEAAH
ncbi:MAG TPA: DUF2911 domain-containing protein [Acidobacteriaceae bacterium]|nr:DUF2911 domain-containing protein [Acidobacteriaceae bacterium]